jgi:hypothetical protein
MSRKIWGASIAGALLIGVGLIASAVSSPATASAQENTDEGEDGGEFSRGLGLLDEVLDDLVVDGTITQDQADAIIDASETKISDLREKYEDRWQRPFHGGPGAWFGRGFRFGSLLDDGGIDQDEYDSLADDHPLKQANVTDFLEDGLITPEELSELEPELRWVRPDEDG